MSKQIHRYEVPIDDQVHEFSLTGNILHVAQRSDHAVEFWAFDIEGNPVEAPGSCSTSTAARSPTLWRGWMA